MRASASASHRRDTSRVTCPSARPTKRSASRFERALQSVGRHDSCELDPRADVELPEDVPQIRVDRVGRHEQLLPQAAQLVGPSATSSAVASSVSVRLAHPYGGHVSGAERADVGTRRIVAATTSSTRKTGSTVHSRALWLRHRKVRRSPLVKTSPRAVFRRLVIGLGYQRPARSVHQQDSLAHEREWAASPPTAHVGKRAGASSPSSVSVDP